MLGGIVVVIAFLPWFKSHKSSKVQDTFKSDFKNIDNIRKNMSEIFEKDFSLKEADELAKKYKSICEIKDDNEFAEKLFEQLRNYIQENEVAQSQREYYNNILEQEAYNVSKLAKEVFGWLL